MSVERLDTWTLADTPPIEVQRYLAACRAQGWVVERSEPDGRHMKHVLARPLPTANHAP